MFRVLFLVLCVCVLPLVGVAQTYSIAWDRTFGTENGDDAPVSVIQAPDGHIMVFGYYGTDMFALKIDTAGNTLWEKTYGGWGSDACFSAVESVEKDGYVLAGLSNSPRHFDQSHDSKGLVDVWIVKIDHDGNKVWDQRYGGSGNDQANAILQISNGYLIAGITESPISGDVTEEPRGTVNNGLMGYDLWFLVLDKAGTLIRQKRFGGDNFEYNYSGIAHISTDKYAFHTTTKSGQTGDLISDSYGRDDYLLVITDTLLNIVSQKRFGGNYNELTNCLFINSDYLYLCGESKSFASGNKISENIGLTGLEDGWIVKTDTQGNKIWDKSIGGGGWCFNYFTIRSK